MLYNTGIYDRCELVLHSVKSYDNPFLDVSVDAVFTHESGRVVTLPGFWNGGNEWKVRFSPDRVGSWSYKIVCSDAANTSLFEDGTVIAADRERRTKLEEHGYIVIPEGKRYLAYEDGTPFFWLADTHWQMPDYERMNECNYPGCTCGNQFKHMVEDRIKKGFTAYQTYFDSAESSGGGNEHVHHWWTEKYTLINPSAFNETMDVMMEYLASRGLACAIGFGVHITSMIAYKSDPKPILAFARYVVARYACYPVLWITAQEITYDKFNAFAVWKQVGALVGQVDGYHRPNSAHMQPMEYSDPLAQSLDQEPWHQWWCLQGGHGGIERMEPRFFYQSYYETASKKLFMETESQYEDLYCGFFCGHDASRVSAWQALLSGAAGFTYGVTGIWATTWNNTDQFAWQAFSPEPWYIGLDKPGSAEVGHLRTFMEYVGWYRLTPSFDHTFGAFELRKFVSVAHKDQDILVYYFFASADDGGLLKGLKKNARYQARWFDPVNGGFTDIADVLTDENGMAAIPEKPSKRDWVLLLNTEYLGAYEKKPFPVFGGPMAPWDAKPGEQYAITVTASSENFDHPAKNLTDGDPATYWEGFAPRTSQTLIADLGEAKELGYLRIATTLPETRILKCRLYVSDDREHWELVSERPAETVAIGGQYPVYYEALSGKHRYVKLFINSTMEAAMLPLRELSILAKA